MCFLDNVTSKSLEDSRLLKVAEIEKQVYSESRTHHQSSNLPHDPLCPLHDGGETQLRVWVSEDGLPPQMLPAGTHKFFQSHPDDLQLS
jgi:hypothetical protein